MIFHFVFQIICSRAYNALTSTKTRIAELLQGRFCSPLKKISYGRIYFKIGGRFGQVVRGTDFLYFGLTLRHMGLNPTQTACKKPTFCFWIARWFHLEIFCFHLTYLIASAQNEGINLDGLLIPNQKKKKNQYYKIFTRPVNQL